MNIDLHTHSYFSDGEHSPEELVSKAKGKVSVFSITDHNTIKYDKDIAEIAQKNGIDFIEGIEISTLYRQATGNISLHILGYGKNLDRRLLQQQLQETIDGYNLRAKKIVVKLNQEFPDLKLDFESLRENSHEAYASRNTLAIILVEYLKNISIKDALKQYIFVKEDDSWMMKTEDSFSLIKDAGGISVLAHSGRELRKMGVVAYEAMIRDFVKSGLRGLEVYYPKHTTEELNVIRNIANKYNLYITGGSDWHGEIYTPNAQIGLEAEKKDVELFLKDILGLS